MACVHAETVRHRLCLWVIVQGRVYAVDTLGLAAYNSPDFKLMSACSLLEAHKTSSYLKQLQHEGELYHQDKSEQLPFESLDAL